MQHSSDHTNPGLSTEKSEYPDEALQDVHAQLVREKEEPTEGLSPLPIFMLFIFGTLVFWGGIYIAQYSGGFDPLIYNEHLKPVKKTEMAGPAPPFDYIAHGKKIYNRDCIACHQATGSGIPGVFPPLVGSHWVTGDDKITANIVLSGLMGPIEVGDTVYNSVMPPLGSHLKDRDIAGVLSFVRQEWGNSAASVSEDLVAGIREEQGLRANPWTIDELISLYPKE